MSTAGYSNTPLSKKLGVKPGMSAILYNPIEHYSALLGEVYNSLDIHSVSYKEDHIDFIHLFCTNQRELESISLELKKSLKKTGIMWVSWPKGSSSINTDIKRDLIREFLLDNNLVDTKVAAIDSDWSGLKFVYRLKDR